MRKATSNQKSTWLAVLLICSSLVVAQPGFAGCNTNSCWKLEIIGIYAKTDGKVWFLTDDPDGLGSLAPANGCIVQTQPVGAGMTHSSLYIRADDPDRDEKFAILLTAYTTGSTVWVYTDVDPATGWCALGELRLL